METKNIILIVVVAIIVIAIRFLRSKNGSGSVLSSWKRGKAKESDRDNKNLSDDDYEPYSGK